MQKVSGILGLKEESEVGGALGGEGFVPCLKQLMKHKYGDLILLCTVVAAFVVLLVVSALG